MNIYVFSSTNLTNIWAGVGAKMWAVSVAQGTNASILAKARSMKVGAFGLIYCVETQSLTTPFVTRSEPDLQAEIRNVWPEPWRLPFRIMPLGTPDRQVSKDRLAEMLPALRTSGRHWHHLFLIAPTTAFAASVVDDGDWDLLVRQLAEV